MKINKKSMLVFSTLGLLVAPLPLAVSCSSIEEGNISVSSFEATCEQMKAVYSFNFKGQLPDEGVINVNIFEVDSQIKPEDINLITEKVEVIGSKRDFIVEIEVIKNLYKTHNKKFSIVFTWKEKGKSKICDFAQAFNLAYEVSDGQSITLNSPSTQPVEESKASFSFSLNGPAFIENGFYAHIIQEGDILAFDGSDDPDSEYFINQTSGQFALPIKIIKSGVVDSVNFGIEFRWVDSTDGKVYVQNFSNFFILPTLLKNINVYLDDIQVTYDVGVENTITLKFHWQNETLPDDKNLSIFIDGTNDVQFEDATRTKTIEINDQTDQNITLGFNSFEQEKGSQFNLKFSYLLSGNAWIEGTLLTLEPCKAFVDIDAIQKKIQCDDNEKGILTFNWLSGKVLPDHNLIHLTIVQEEGDEDISFISGYEISKEVDVLVDKKGKVEQPVIFTNFENWLSNTDFDVICTYSILGRKVEQLISGITLKPTNTQSHSFTFTGEFDEINHQANGKLTWSSAKKLVDNKIKITITDYKEYISFEDGTWQKEFTLVEKDGKLEADVVFKNVYNYESNINFNLRFDFETPTSDGKRHQGSWNEPHLIKPMKQHFVVDPRIYYDKNASYNYGEVFFEYTDSTFPTDNKVTLRIPENCGYSFSPSSIVTTTDVALDSTKASQVYSAKIYVATGHDLEEKNIDVEFNAQFSGTNHQRTFKTSIIDLDEKGLLFDLPEGGWEDYADGYPTIFNITIATWMTHIEIEEDPSVTFIPAESVEESKRVYMPSLNSGQIFIPSFATKWTIEIDAGWYIDSSMWYMPALATHTIIIKYKTHGRVFTKEYPYTITYRGGYDKI